MAQDWDIKPRAESCHTCEQPFQDRQPYNAALVFGEEGYVRTDYCDGCWAKAEQGSAAYSVWQGIFRLPPPKEEEALKKETVESLLRKLMEEEDEAHRNVIYILAVMLERKRLLIEKDVQTREDGTMIRLYEHRKTGETFLVPDPHLRLGELEPVQEQVIEMLGGAEKSQSDEAETAEPEVPTIESGVSDEAAAGLKDGFYSKG